MNQVLLVGNLTRDPEVKKTKSGKSYIRFSVAVNDGKNEDGTPKAQFIQCIAWEKTAELLDTYCKKGSKLGVIGRIVNSSYEDPKIKDRRIFTTDVVVSQIEFLSSKNSDSQVIEDADDVVPQ